MNYESLSSFLKRFDATLEQLINVALDSDISVKVRLYEEGGYWSSNGTKSNEISFETGFANISSSHLSELLVENKIYINSIFPLKRKSSNETYNPFSDKNKLIYHPDGYGAGLLDGGAAFYLKSSHTVTPNNLYILIDDIPHWLKKLPSPYKKKVTFTTEKSKEVTNNISSPKTSTLNRKINNSHALLAALWFYKDKPKPRDIKNYHDFMSCIGDVVVKYKLDCYRDDEDGCLSYVNDRNQEKTYSYGKKYKNIVQTLKKIRDDPEPYLVRVRNMAESPPKNL